jgi:hypothetical protein
LSGGLAGEISGAEAGEISGKARGARKAGRAGKAGRSGKAEAGASGAGVPLTGRTLTKTTHVFHGTTESPQTHIPIFGSDYPQVAIP